ncbi:hypothetical protein N431DRAFT_386070, partial [Stipitochalara longipes BDJ]
MPLRRRVVEKAGEPTRIRFVLETPDVSIIDFAELLKSMTPSIRSNSQEEDRNRILQEEFKYAQFLMTEGELELCHQACIDLINATDLPVDLKIKTVQLMSTLVSLDQALSYLEDALRLAGDKMKEEPNDLVWFGLHTTTRDQMWKIHTIQGSIKFHREITFGDPIAAARDRDLKKGKHLMRKQVRFDDRVIFIGDGDPVKRGVRFQDDDAEMQLCRFDRYVRGRKCFQAELTISKGHFGVRVAPEHSTANYKSMNPPNPSCSEQTSRQNFPVLLVFDDEMVLCCGDMKIGQRS